MTKRLLLGFVLFSALVGAGNMVVNQSAGSPAWWYCVVPAQEENGGGLTDDYLIWCDTGTIGAGTASKLGFNVRSYSTNQDVKIGLYSNAGAKLQEGTVSITGTGWVEVTITNETTTAANYKLAFMPSGDTVNTIGYKGNPSGTTRYYASNGGGYSLPANLPASEGSDGIGYVLGVYVTP